MLTASTRGLAFSLVLTSVFCIMTIPLRAQLQEGPPASVGMSQQQLDAAASILAEQLDSGPVTAASIVVARRNRIVLARGFGKLSHDAEAPCVRPDSIFLLASITKPVTGCALMILVDRGLVSLDDPVSHYLPEFQGGERARVTVRNLLSHISGLPDMLPQNRELRRAHSPLSGFVQGAAKTPLLYSPGSSFRYQSKGILLAAEIVERVSGQRLRDFEKEEMFEPLGMRHSALGMGDWKLEETVWVETSPNSNQADLDRFGPNSPYWRDMGHPWGGMHSSALDLAVLLQTMLNGGEYGGNRVFSRAAVDAMTSDQNGSLEAPWGLGWALRDSPVWNFFGELVSAKTFGHTGATGTVAWADPERDLLCVILTNRMVENGRLLRRVSNAVAAAVEN